MALQLVGVAKALPLVLLGLLTHHLLFKDADIELPGLGDGCPQVAAYSWRIGHEGIDNFLCVLVQFFKAALSSAEGQWVTGYVGSLAAAAFAFMAVEGSRYGSGWLLSLLPIHALLFQLKGISVVVPLVWLPLYFLYGGNHRSSEANKLGKRVSIFRVMLIALGVAALQFNIAGMIFPLEDLQKELFILAFQFAPILLPLLWLPVRTTESTPQVRGHKAIIALHILEAGAGLLWHLVALVYVVRDPNLLRVALEALTNHTPGSSTFPVFFLALDCVVLFVALLYLAMLEDGFRVGSVILVGAVAFGPAASLSFYFAYREQRILISASDYYAKKRQ